MESLVDWLGRDQFLVKGSYDPVTDESKPVGPLKLLQHQKDILGHTFTLDEETGKFPYTTVIYSAPKKSGKTTVAAAIGTWFALQGPAAQEIYCLASDLEHAQGRAFSDIAFNLRRQEIAIPRKSRVEFPNDTFIQALAQEYKSASGARQAMTIWDELWAYMSDSSRRMWAEMTPISIPGVPYNLRVIVTYAGFEGESELLHDLYEAVVEEGEPVEELSHIVNAAGKPVCFKRGSIFAYWDTEPRMPWQTPAYYEEQMATLRPHEYLRLHENRWVTTHEQFIPTEWWDEAEKHFSISLETDYKNDRRKVPVVIGVDGGVKRDSTAIVAVQYDYETGMIDLAFHSIATPTPDERIDLEQVVENYLLAMSEQFKIAAVYYDPRELLRSMKRLKDTGMNVIEYQQTLTNMIAASGSLYELLRTQRLRAYPAPDLREHIRFAVAQDKGGGFRIVKPGNHSAHHIDGAIALAMAVHGAIKTHGIDTSKPIRIEHPSGEVSGWEAGSPDRDMQKMLPEELRDDKPVYVATLGGWNDYGIS